MKKLLSFLLCFAIFASAIPICAGAKTVTGGGNFTPGDTLASLGDFTTQTYTFEALYDGDFTMKMELTVSQESGSAYELAYAVKIMREGAAENEAYQFTKVFPTAKKLVSDYTYRAALKKGKYQITITTTVDYYRGNFDVARLLMFTSFDCFHPSSETKTVKEPTCSSEGLRQKICDQCGEVFSEEKTEKSAHTPESQWTVISKASCSKEGKSVKYCTICKQEVETEIFEKLPHTFGEWTESKKSSCSQSGQRKRVCTVCGEEKTEDLEKLPHTFGEWTESKKATCSDEGEETRACSVCNYEEMKNTEKPDHTFGKWEETKKPSCANEGEKTRTCSVCGENDRKATQKTAHTFGEWKITKNPTCTVSGQHTHTCSVCSYKETQEINPQDHNYSAWSTTKQPTESSTGTKTRRCSVCGATETKSVNKLVHGKEVYSKVTKSPTCTEKGVTEIYCSYCNKKVDAEYANAKGHSVTKWEISKEATANADGQKQGRCVNCGTTLYESYKFERPGRSGFTAKRSYNNRFTDIKSTNWYYEYVKKSYEYELVNGMSDTSFSPDTYFTVAQALTVAANIHSAFFGDKVEQKKAQEKWYDPYVNYCVNNKIITKNQFSDYNRNITRGEMAVVFANILPDEEYSLVRTGNPKDMTSANNSFEAVKKLYRAGIVSGDKETSNYRPDDMLKRSEASAIFTAIVISSYRAK